MAPCQCDSCEDLFCLSCVQKERKCPNSCEPFKIRKFNKHLFAQLKMHQYTCTYCSETLQYVELTKHFCEFLVKREHASLSQMVTEIEQKIEELEREQVETKWQLEEAKESNDSLNEKLVDTQTSLDQARMDLAQEQRRARMLEEKVEEMSQKLVNVKQETDKKNPAISLLQKLWTFKGKCFCGRKCDYFQHEVECVCSVCEKQIEEEERIFTCRDLYCHFFVCVKCSDRQALGNPEEEEAKAAFIKFKRKKKDRQKSQKESVNMRRSQQELDSEDVQEVAGFLDAQGQLIQQDEPISVRVFKTRSSL